MKISRVYMLKNAPWALLTTLTAGLANYIILIIFSRVHDAETVGSFRLALSIAGLLSLASIIEANKVALTAVAIRADAVARRIFKARFTFALAGSVVGLFISAYFYSRGERIYIPLLIASLVLPLMSASELFEYINQGRKDFRANALNNLARFGAAVAVVSTGTALMIDPYILMASYFVVFAVANSIIYFQTSLTLNSVEGSGGEVRDGIKLSVSSVLVNVLEHVDKLLVYAFFDLKTLGIYTVGVSTGRLMLFMIKPALTIFNPLLVEQQFPPKTLGAVFLLATVAGVAASLALPPFFTLMFGPGYEDALFLAQLMFCGAGFYCVGILVYNTSVYNTSIPMTIPIANNIISPLLVLLFLLVALATSPQAALILFALSYPLRHLLNALVLTLLKKRIAA